jgi:hypothetical protein
MSGLLIGIIASGLSPKGAQSTRWFRILAAKV